MNIELLMLTGIAILFVILIFIAFGQVRINSRVDTLRDSNTASNIRVDHIEKDVHDIKEEQRAISEGYARQYQDIAVMIRESIAPLERKIESMDNHLRDTGK